MPVQQQQQPCYFCIQDIVKLIRKQKNTPSSSFYSLTLHCLDRFLNGEVEKHTYKYTVLIQIHAYNISIWMVDTMGGCKEKLKCMDKVYGFFLGKYNVGLKQNLNVSSCNQSLQQDTGLSHRNIFH